MLSIFMLSPNEVDVDLLHVPDNHIVFQDAAIGSDGRQITKRFPSDYRFVRMPNYYLDGNGTRRQLLFGDLAFTPTLDDNIFEGPEDFVLNLIILYPSFVTISPGFDVHIVSVYDNDGMSCS